MSIFPAIAIGVMLLAEPPESLRSRMERVMGTMPTEAPAALEPRIVEETKHDGYVRRKVTLVVEPGDRMPCYLSIPTDGFAGKRPAMLCLHQTIGIGKGEPVGLGTAESKRYAVHLVKRGYVCLAPDYPSFGEYPFDFKKSRFASGTLKAIWNNMRAVDYLQSLPEVDPARIGVIGHSLGGHNAIFTAVWDDRLKVVVSSCGFCSFHDYYKGDLTGWCSDRYMPRIATEFGKDPKRMPFDFGDLAAALAPRGFFACAPLHDDNFAVAGVRKVIDAARPAYRQAGAEANLQADYPNAGHDFPEESRQRAYAFVDRILKPTPPRKAELVSVRKIWDRAPHNAFTDLIRHRGEWLCVFREGKAHVSPDGALRVIASSDGDAWTSRALVTSANSDLRDAKIVTTPDGRLMLSGAGAWHDKTKHTHQSLSWFSSDAGNSWTAPTEIGDPDFWLWRTTWHKEAAYAIGYGCKPENRGVRLYSTADGKRFDTRVQNLAVPGYPNESALLFDERGVAHCLLRRDGPKDSSGLIGEAPPPYTQWKWRDLGVKIGGPQMLALPDGRRIAVVRLYAGKVRTSVCFVDRERGGLDEALELPSGGDCSYAGLVWHDGLLWISYYSSHEGKTSVYLAKVKIDGDK